MSLTLVTGPANAGKAGHVLGGYRDRLDDEPILVVPAFRDVQHAQRELAEHGAVFGTRVVRFRWLFETVAERCGAPPARGRRATPVQRQLIVEHAIGAAGLDALAASAGRPGFVRAASRLVAELGRSMVEPPRLIQALRAWAGDGPRRARAEDMGRLYAAYCETLAEARLVDDEQFAAAALAALREDPASFGGTPVFVYGFDDFTPLELELLELLATLAGSSVSVSLPHEDARAAFEAVRPTFERLAALADRHIALTSSDEHYHPESRRPLDHLERHLFEAPGERPDPAGAVRLHVAGGERAEVELVGAEVLKLLRAGMPAGQVAVVFRRTDPYASLVDRVFTAYGIPFSLERWAPLAHTGLGGGALALLRCATDPEATADDLIAYLRTPGRLDEPGLADWLESMLRQAGARTVQDARAVWEEHRWPLAEVDRLAQTRTVAALAAQLDEEAERLFARPYERQAHVFADDETEDPRARQALRAALTQVAALGGAGIAPERERLHDLLAELPVRLGFEPAPDRVQVARPESIRARRFQAVFACGLQEGEFPRLPQPEPFLSDDERREIARDTGLVLPFRDDRPARERYLFYACASRAERLLALSWRDTDEEGAPQVRSFLVDDVRDVLDSAELDRNLLRRPLAQVTWSPEDAPTEVEWARAAALVGPDRSPPAPERLDSDEVLGELRSRDRLSAAALESYSDCPVKWLVERLIDPEALEPDPEPMVRGRYAHDVLELTYSRLAGDTGTRKVTPETLPAAERILLVALREREGEFRISPTATRVRTAVRRLEFDLLRHLRAEAEAGGEFEPAELELEFGMEGSLRPPVPVGDGLAVRGRIDRVDTWDGYFLVRDYKSGKKVHPVASWERDRRLQVALYMLAVRELLGLEPAGGVYVPLAGAKREARGIVLDELREQLGDGFGDRDFKSREEIDSQLERARERALELAGRMRAGDVKPCPGTCAWNGGCSYPSICREER